jgi:hypothetical protein
MVNHTILCYIDIKLVEQEKCSSIIHTYQKIKTKETPQKTNKQTSPSNPPKKIPKYIN